jgi:hypothetical protein
MTAGTSGDRTRTVDLARCQSERRAAVPGSQLTEIVAELSDLPVGQQAIEVIYWPVPSRRDITMAMTAAQTAV